MPKFNNFREIEKFLQGKINSTLKNEVAETVIETMQEKIEEEVYSVYDPKVYERQGYQGGLTDPSNIEVQVVDDNTISVENIRFDGNREVAEIVETGQGYMYNFPYNGRPRPFTEATREELRNTDKLKNSMRRGLKKRGISAE